MKKIWLFLIIFVFLGTAVWAANSYVWTGNVFLDSSNWRNPGNWDFNNTGSSFTYPGGDPDDIVFINGALVPNATVNVPSGPSLVLSELVLAYGVTVNLNGHLDNVTELRVIDNATLITTGAPFNASTVYMNGNLTLSGNFATMIGVLNVNNTPYLMPSTINNSSFGNINVTGATTLHASLTMSAFAVTFGGNINGNGHPLTVSGVNVTFSGGSNIGAMDVNGTVTFQTALLEAASLTVNGTSTVNANITTGGAQTFNGNVELGGGLTGAMRTFTGTTIMFGGNIIGGERSLTVTGHAVFSGTVDDIVSLTVSGTSDVHADITTAVPFGFSSPNGGQTFTGAVTLHGDITFSAGNGQNINFQQAVNSATTFQMTTTTIAGGSTGFSGNVNVGTLTVNGNSFVSANITTTAAGGQTFSGAVTLGGAGTRNFSAGAGNWVWFQSIVNGGSALAVTAGNARFSGVVGGTTVLAGLEVAAGISEINANITTTGAQTFTGAVILGGAGSRNFTAGGIVTFLDTVDGTSLTVNGASAVYANITTNGNQTFTGLVTLHANNVVFFALGSTANFTSGVGVSNATFQMTTIGANTIFGGNVNVGTLEVHGNSQVNADITTTSGTQEFFGNVTLGLPANATRIFTGATVTFNGAISAVALNFLSLTVNGDAVFNGNVNGVANLTVNNGTSTINNANINTTGNQTFGTTVANTVTLSGGARTFTGALVTFNGDIAGGGNNLTVTGNAEFNGGGGGGGVNAIGAIQVTGNATFNTGLLSAASLNVTGISAVNADIGTATTQNFIGNVTLGGLLANATRSFIGTTVTFNGTIVGDNRPLTVNGDAEFNGNVSGVTILTANFASEIHGNITTTGTQTFVGAVTLVGAVTRIFTANTGQLVHFQNTVSSTTNSGLQVTNANVRFDNNVGTLASVNIMQGTSEIHGNITTTGAQTFGGAVALHNDINFTANAGQLVHFQNTVSGGGNSLTVTTANAQFGGDVGASADIARLSSVLVAGTSTINANIYTTGDQSYAAITLLGVTQTLSSSGGSVIASGQLTGSSGITVHASQGITMNNTGNSLSGTVTLNNNQTGVTPDGDIEFRTSNIIASIMLNAINDATTGNITIAQSGALTIGIGGISTQAGGNVTLGATLSTVGVVTQTGIITTGTLTINSTGAVTLGNTGNSVGTLSINNTSGNIAFTNSGALTIDTIATATTGTGAVIISTVNGGITVQGTINSYRLTLNAGSDGEHAVTIQGGSTITTRTTSDDCLISGTPSVHIFAGTLAGDGNIVLSGTDSLACADLLTTATFSTNQVTGNRLHFHTRLDHHIVYGTEFPTPLIPPPGFLFLQSDSDLGSNLNLFTRGTGNIYVVHVGNETFSNTRNLTLRTGTAGIIEIRGEYVSSGTLSLDTGGVDLRNADVTLTGHPFNTGTLPITLIGTAGTGSEIEAINITLGVITGNANTFELTSAGTIDLTGGTGLQWLEVNGNSIIRGNISSNQRQIYNGNMTLAADVNLTSATGNITLNNNVIRDTIVRNFTINAGTGNVIAAGSLGSDAQRLGVVTINGDNIELAAVFANGIITIIGSDIELNGNISTITNNITITGDVTLNSNITVNTGIGTGNISITGDVDGTGMNFRMETAGGNITVSGTIDAEDLEIGSAANVTFNGAVTADNFTQIAGTGTTWFNAGGDAVHSFTADFTFDGLDLTIDDEMSVGADFDFDGAAFNLNDQLEIGGDAYIDNLLDFTVGTNGSLEADGFLTVTGNTVNNGTIFASNTLNAVTAIEFQGNYTSSPAGRLVGSPTTNPDIQFNGNVILGELTLNGNRIIFAAAGTQELSVALPAAPQIDGNVLVRRGSTVNLLANSAIVQTNTRTLELEGELLLMAAAVLDVSLGSWHIGAGLAIPNSFTGNDGQLVLGTGSQLITNHFNLPGGAGPAFIVDNTGHASISIGGNANIADNTNVDLDGGGDLPLLVLEMARTGNQIQNLITDQILGSLLVGTASQTVLWTPATYPDPLLQGTISFRGRVKIESAAAPAGLVAGNHDIIMYAGLTGNRDLTLHLQDGPDTVYYTRWETTAPLPPSLMPPFTGVPNMNDFVFRQNAGREVSFRRDPTVSNLHPVFFEIAGNTFWRTFECTEPGAVIQFSRHPHHHTISGRFTVQGPAGGSNQDFVTITRFMEHRPEDTVIWPSEDAATFPFLFDQSLGMEPPFRLWAGGTANFGDLGQWALPVFIPSINLKLNSIPMERERTKYWNLNLLNNADVRPLEYFRRVTILFSHAYNTRIPVLREAMQLEVVPYFDPVAGTGFFNYDWLELRKILYSFTEDFTGNGRLDRIRVQTNISLYADFSAFDVYVEGFEINRCDQWALGHGLVGFYNGFQLVSDFTGDTGFDNDSFFIYLIERPDFDTGSTPRWSVIRNESLRDEIARDSLVGEPGIDVNMIPFSTIPPRISYTLTLPGHPQTFVRMSEPVVSGTQGNNITNDIAGMALDNARVEIPGAATTFSWRYTPLDGAEVVHTVNVPAGDLAFILEWQNAFSTGDLAALNNIFGDPTSSMTLGYFMMSDVVDQGQRPMDWSDWNIDPAFFLYYQPPKLPLNWGYTSFARVYGNQHLRDHPDLPNDFDQDHPNATSAAGTVPLSDVFLPPNRLLTPEMMTLLAQGDGHLVTPSMFVPNYDVYRRVTDALVSIPPSQDNASNFFAWPVFAEHQDLPNPDGFPNIDSGWWTRPQDYDNPGIIWVFDGTAFLETDNIRLQAHSSLAGLGLELFWATNVPARFRIPQQAPLRGRSTGGLWQPLPGDFELPSLFPPGERLSLLYNFAPHFTPTFALQRPGIQVGAEPASDIDLPLVDFLIDQGDHPTFSSGQKFEFLFRFTNAPNSPSDMFISRLNIPPGSPIPNNWFELVRPFGFDIQDIRPQRGGVTILNNVINSTNMESVYIRYQLTRPGRVTVQVFTLDGTLVRTIRRNEFRGAGIYTDSWNGTNNGGRPVARGMYFVRVVGPDIDEIRQVMVVR